MRVDEYSQRGPFEMARLGTQVVTRNNMTKEQHDQFMRLQAARLPEVIAEINAHVEAIARVVQRYDPLSLLQRGYWEEFAPRMLRDPGESETVDSSRGQRLVDYVQSMIAAVPASGVEKPSVDEEGWGSLIRNVEGLFDKINLEYVFCRTAEWRVTGQGLPADRHMFYVKALLMWCNVTGHRYHHQEIEHLKEFLAPHSAVLQRLWNIDADGVVAGLARILHALSRGLGESMETMFSAFEEYRKAADGADEAKMAILLTAKLESMKQDQALRKAITNIHGVDLFRVDEYLPNALLRELSWAPGECTTFFDGQDQSGWPTRVWPRTLRPFLAIGTSFYCFDVHSLFDNIYRVLQRSILRLEPSYRHTWDTKQKSASEAFPLKLFQKLFPQAKILQSIFYQTKEFDANSQRKWCELDGLVCVDDHLFIIEVKAGVFTLAPPETGFDLHLRSIEKLIFNAADQGDRFLQWLDTERTIDLFDDAHTKIGELSRNNFEHVTVCAVTLDAFTELAAKSSQLRALVGREGSSPFWSLSIGDLMTYTELFDNPLSFLHYVEKRCAAICSDKLALDDEFDHYGMYLKYNNYAGYAATVPGDKQFWTGYRTAIDAYFDLREHKQPAQLPRQDMPPLFTAMVNVLARSAHPRRRMAASFLLDYSGSGKDNIARTLANLLADQSSQSIKPFSVYGEGLQATFYCWRSNTLRSQVDALLHAKACMLLAGESTRLLFELIFSVSDDLLGVEPTLLRIDDISKAERVALAPVVEQLREERLRKVTFNRAKLGRNDPCPCGSGKKFKKCCLR